MFRMFTGYVAIADPKVCLILKVKPPVRLYFLDTQFYHTWSARVQIQAKIYKYIIPRVRAYQLTVEIKKTACQRKFLLLEVSLNVVVCCINIQFIYREGFDNTAAGYLIFTWT